MQTKNDYGLNLSSKKYLGIKINEDNDIYIYDQVKLKIGNPFPQSFRIFSPSFYTSYRIKQNPDQLLLFFYVPSFYFIKSPEHYYKEIMTNVTSIREKYKERLKCYFLMVDSGRIRNENKEQVNTYYSYFAKHFNCIFTMSQEDEFAWGFKGEPMYILVDKNKIIRYIQKITNKECFLTDYQEIYPIIDNILENKPILGQFSKEEVYKIEKKLEKFIIYVKEKDKKKSISRYLFSTI